VSGPPRPGSYRAVWANREIAGLLVAQAASQLGDQVARVAIAILVYRDTGQLVLTGLALAVIFLPDLVGSFLLAPLADRVPRRALLLACDAARLVLVGAMALTVSSQPAWVPLLLLVAASLLTTPFEVARSALFAVILPGDAELVAGQALATTIHMLTQVLGALAAGTVLVLVSPTAALGIDAATFGISFAVVLASVTPRPAVRAGGVSPWAVLSDLREGARELAGDPVRRSLVALACASTVVLMAPEAVALGYRPDLGALAGGALLASVPAGSALGAFLMPRLSFRRQLRLVLPLAAGACLPLFATSVNPPPAVAGALWFVSGVLQAYVLTVIAALALMTPDSSRGRVLGVAAGAFSASSVVVLVVVAWLAGSSGLGPAKVVSLCGAVGLVVVAVARAVWPSEAFRTVVR